MVARGLGSQTPAGNIYDNTDNQMAKLSVRSGCIKVWEVGGDIGVCALGLRTDSCRSMFAEEVEV